MKENKEEKLLNQEENMNLANKEEEIKRSYEEPVMTGIIVDDKIIPNVIEPEPKDTYNYEVYEEEEIWNKKIKRTKRIINIFFGLIIAILIMIAVDVICVAKYDVGPFFAIPLHTYNDGGSKEYYGLGYKVIKYHQTQGRRDKEIGTWSLKYNTNPITIEDIDLAIEFSEDMNKSYSKYYKQFVRIISTLKKVDEKNHTITIGYQDDGNKYDLIIKCDIVKEQNNLSKLEKGKQITIIGSVKDFKQATKKQSNRLYISNCFAEQ